MGKESKYFAKKHECRAGHLHDSKKEAKRCDELMLLEQCGEISDLKNSVRYELIPAQYVPINGKNKCIERAVHYIADFTYSEGGKLVVEDVKGYKGNTGAYNLFKLKRKLMLYKYGIIVKEI